MTVEELLAKCKQAIEAGHQSIILVVPGAAPRGERIRLDRKSRRKCPMGEVLSWTERGTVASFAPIEVLAWLVAIGAVTIAEEGKE